MTCDRCDKPAETTFFDPLVLRERCFCGLLCAFASGVQMGLHVSHRALVAAGSRAGAESVQRLIAKRIDRQVDPEPTPEAVPS